MYSGQYPPRLSGLGFALVGGRLLSAPDGPAAQFMYEDTDRRRITVSWVEALQCEK